MRHAWHVGLVASHFFLRRRQVQQPEAVEGLEFELGPAI
jgi:hypothetical protein